MLGSNPSADSVASTDAGGCYGIPLSPSAYRNPYRERHQSVKSWGCGGKAPACGAGTQASSDVRALSHNASAKGIPQWLKPPLIVFALHRG